MPRLKGESRSGRLRMLPLSKATTNGSNNTSEAGAMKYSSVMGFSLVESSIPLTTDMAAERTNKESLSRGRGEDTCDEARCHSSPESNVVEVDLSEGGQNHSANNNHDRQVGLQRAALALQILQSQRAGGDRALQSHRGKQRSLGKVTYFDSLHERHRNPTQTDVSKHYVEAEHAAATPKVRSHRMPTRQSHTPAAVPESSRSASQSALEVEFKEQTSGGESVLLVREWTAAPTET
jgi:hypothetical protein